jgi:hypothetical protein
LSERAESNDFVRPINAKAMPFMLCEAEAWDIWLTGSAEEALELQALQRLVIILRDAVALFIHITNSVLSSGICLLSRKPVPSNGSATLPDHDLVRASNHLRRYFAMIFTTRVCEQ